MSESNGKAPAPDASAAQLRGVLRDRFGHDDFRPGQGEVVRALLAGRDVLAVMPTGAGKSLLYQLPALVLPGLTVVVSPLIALMKDQTDKLDALGVDARTINSSLTAREKDAAEDAVENGSARLLYVTPERFRDREFFAALLERDVSLFVVDEAHCISEWGHDFRPDYMLLGSIARRLGRPPVLALTATATPDVQSDIVQQLGMREPFRTNLDLIRLNLLLEVKRTVNTAEKDEALQRIMREVDGTGIIYSATVGEAERIHEELSGRWPLALYHGRRTGAQRKEAQERFMDGSVKAVVATNAFGLGIDKPDIRFIVHYHFPGSPESYYQEAGRSGRDGEDARCVILYREEDRQIQSYFLGGKYPSIEDAARVGRAVNALAPEARAPLDALAEAADVGRSKTRIVLTLLKRQEAVREHRGGAWERLVEDVAGIDLGADLLDYEERRQEDRRRLDAMVGYCRTAGCRTRFLLDFFGLEPDAGYRCGHCDNDTDPIEVEDPAAREGAEAGLRRPDSARAEPTSPYQPGDVVSHPDFGTGHVVDARGDKVDVDFDDGRRTILVEYLESGAGA